MNAKLDEFYWEWPGVLSCLELNLKGSGGKFLEPKVDATRVGATHPADHPQCGGSYG